MMVPEFLERLNKPEIKTILISGCGGGFDFVHGMLLYPIFRQIDKRVVFLSYSFGDLAKIPESKLEIIAGKGRAKLINPGMKPDPQYSPEINLLSYLRKDYEQDLVQIYACYARDFTVRDLRSLYEQIIEREQVDALITMDGGSDSLMVGDEAGLGDVVEDLVSVTAIAGLSHPKDRILCTVGVGCDRFNDVSDASALRAISELTALGASLGELPITRDSAAHHSYRYALSHIYSRQSFRSIVAGSILSAIAGEYGNATLPEALRNKLTSPETLFIWPIMKTIYAFDVPMVALRSQLPGVIRDCRTVRETWEAVTDFRKSIGESIRPVENLPDHESMRAEERFSFDAGGLIGGIFDELSQRDGLMPGAVLPKEIEVDPDDQRDPQDLEDLPEEDPGKHQLQKQYRAHCEIMKRSGVWYFSDYFRRGIQVLHSRKFPGIQHIERRPYQLMISKLHLRSGFHTYLLYRIAGRWFDQDEPLWIEPDDAELSLRHLFNTADVIHLSLKGLDPQELLASLSSDVEPRRLILDDEDDVVMWSLYTILDSPELCRKLTLYLDEASEMATDKLVIKHFEAIPRSRVIRARW
jgi:hypothetical protein